MAAAHGAHYSRIVAEVTRSLADGGVVVLADDAQRIDRDAVWDFLSTKAYWGTWRSREVVEAQIAVSWRVASAFIDGQCVAFGRAISDGYAIAYLSDVFVVESARGRGVGEALVRFIVDDGPGAAFRWMLHTEDAHSLYEKLGFVLPDGRFMERLPTVGRPS